MPLAPSTRLGRYEVVAPIGAGGMSEVYRARDTKLGRDVAVIRVDTRNIFKAKRTLEVTPDDSCR
jgi:serine/threonine protein kinase